ncbi:unnamed protein product [Pieris brassicae]|uniref:AN1-type domain-containing protein n=1 Tax=Pieris brassicae TaxID=7116 RepID=A0A9P0XHT5_PIEBR|nr:unnamed protein product [Pieris brassicae]
MEFPHIGKNCCYKSCNKLDFLPMKCDACKEVYCSDHFAYIKHECPAPNSRDVQVPQCPLCGALVPGKRGEPPDVAVGAHIDNQCTSDPAKERRNKVFTNRCSYKGCKTKEMVPLVCVESAKRRRAAEAALARMKANDHKIANVRQIPSGVTTSNIQGNMTEDEALAHALALSLQDDQQSMGNIRTRVGGEPNSRCTVS